MKESRAETVTLSPSQERKSLTFYKSNAKSKLLHEEVYFNLMNVTLVRAGQQFELLFLSNIKFYVIDMDRIT